MSKKFNVKSYKYDGKLHYEWNSRLIESDDEKVILLGEPGRVLRHYTKGKDFVFNSWCIEIYFYNKNYNYFYDLGADGEIEHYINIALPIIVENEIIKYVDLDIDLVKTNDGLWEVHDEDEFVLHKEVMNYPSEIVELVSNTKNELLQLINNFTYPFDGTFNTTKLEKYRDSINEIIYK